MSIAPTVCACPTGEIIQDEEEAVMPETAIPETEHQERASSGLSVPFLLLTVCGVLLLAVAALIVWPVVSLRPEAPSPSKASPEKQGGPSAAVQKTFRLVVPDGVKHASYLVVPGDGSADSGRDIYLRFRTTREGMKEFVASLGKTLGDLTAEGGSVGFTVDPDDVDSVGLPWKINTKGHLVGLYVDIPEKGDTTGTARVTIDETDAAAPLVYAHVTV